MDSIKLIARNVFYNALAPFKRAYDNFRDDHAYFRNLTQSHGILIQRGASLEVHLISPVPHPKKIRGIINAMLQDINATAPTIPDGSGRILRFYLGSKQGIKFAPQTDPNPDFY
jgi:hypothetical protein